jgi:HD-GYP domain-containing protein (c-di-GMP phosphodiesterase class II)
MKKYMVKDIPLNSFFTKTVYLDQGFVLAAPEMAFSEELVRAVDNWGVQEVYSDGEPTEDYALEKETVLSRGIDDASTIIDMDKIHEAEIFYAAFQEYAQRLFARIMMKSRLNFKPVAEKIKTVVDFMKEDYRFLMRAQKNVTAPVGKDYLVSHAVRSTVISIVIGYYLKLPAHRLIELGTAALLHEIGMMQLSRQTYLKTQALTVNERKAIFGHPVMSFNMLKSFDFPLVISVAALEHHERENGLGYPQHISGEKISLYAKIIAVACSYEALSSKRPHKEARDGYTGMLELLKNEGKQYDDTVVRALVYSLSIYPIGLYVLLSSGKKGQVVDVNPENPRYPVVQIFGELTPDGKNKTVQTSANGISIVRPLTRKEIGG